ncbi:MAG: AmmeMemoRadiSam system radical SAM enzyme [Chloroflexi bacterium]|nr:MAG: AmmeMemoRadiSam system radical SAM enzyme [Chloroflexota bacterium]
MSSILDVLDKMTIEGHLYEKLPDNAVRCTACGHRCLIREGKRGICQVRYNNEGTLMVPWGYVAALQADPVEKKPFFHFLPGSDALTFGMLGCDFHCSYCQNWVTSQAGRNKDSDISLQYARKTSPDQLVEYAVRAGAKVVVSSYNEPLITSEWAVDVFRLANKAGMKCGFVSNGNMTPQAIEFLRPYIVGYKIDLKTMQDKHYRQLGGVLKNVLEGIQLAHKLGLWVEVVTLVIPGFNDSTEELMEAARFIYSVSPDIPWHVTAFHPDYKMTDPSATTSKTLLRAAEIGQEAGLNYVYAGNLPGHVNEYENTYCPQCSTKVIERYGYTILDYQITALGTCPKCGTNIPGIWTSEPETVRLMGPGMPRMVSRIR